MSKHILITGNPVDGFDHYGPFDTPEDAFRFADAADFDYVWWHAPLHDKWEEDGE